MDQHSKEYGTDSEYLMKLPDCGGDDGIKMVRTHFMISDFFCIQISSEHLPHPILNYFTTGKLTK